MAYLPISLWDKDRVLGGQAWIWKEKYDFVGKVAASDLPEWQWRSKNWGPSVVNPMLQVMLQAALKERCKMEAHTIPAEVNGFALVAGNHGPNFSVLIRTKDGEGIPIEAQKMPENGRMIPYSRGSETPTVHFYQTSMKSFAAVLSEWGAPVEDRTGLDGIYDFPLEKFYDGDEPDRDWDIRSLGLKLVPIKVPSVKIVIDHIEPPTPN